MIAVIPLKAERHPKDLYETPQALANAICGRLAGVLPKPERIIEPSAGGGNFVRAVRSVWPSAQVWAIDIDANHLDALREAGANSCDAMDFLYAEPPRPPVSPTLFIGNPPFIDGQGHIEHALKIMGDGDHLAFLLRLSMLGSQERAESLWAKPGLRFLMPVAQRPSFGLNKHGKPGTDNSEYAVFVWKKGYEGNAELLPHLWFR